MFRCYLGRVCVIGGLALGCMAGEAFASENGTEHAKPSQSPSYTDAPFPKKSPYKCARMAHEFALEQRRSEEKCLARGEDPRCNDRIGSDSEQSSAYRRLCTQ